MNLSDQETTLVDHVARVAHQVNKAFCEANGDDSQKDWEDAPEWQKNSARNGVRFVVTNPTADQSAIHESWKKQKLAEGWKYGPVKDEVKKEHHCLVDKYDDLPLSQRTKDRLFKAVVLALIPKVVPDAAAPN